MFSLFNSEFEKCLKDIECSKTSLLEKWDLEKSIKENKFDIFKYILDVRKDSPDYINLFLILEKNNMVFYKYLSVTNRINKYEYYDFLVECIKKNKVKFFKFIINDLKEQNKLSKINLNELFLKAVKCQNKKISVIISRLDYKFWPHIRHIIDSVQDGEYNKKKSLFLAAAAVTAAGSFYYKSMISSKK